MLDLAIITLPGPRVMPGVWGGCIIVRWAVRIMHLIFNLLLALITFLVGTAFSLSYLPNFPSTTPLNSLT